MMRCLPHTALESSTALRSSVALLATLALVTACSSTPDPHIPDAPLGAQHNTSAPRYPLPDGTTLEPADSEPAQEVITEGLLGSLRPDGRPVAEAVPEILARGRLVVGVEQSQNLLGFRNPVTGQLEGFEVDLAHEVARDIFGDPNLVDFRYVDANTWLELLEANEVDFVIRSMSITRERQDQVFFSTPYYTARTRLLVPTYSQVSGIEDLAGKTVCASAGATGVQRIREFAPQANLLQVRSAPDYLLAIQQGQADAVISDDTILSGMIAQDPTTKIVGDVIAVENYGIAFAKPGVRHNTEGLIRQVNTTLERVFRDGTWRKSFQHWFGAYLPAQTPPPTNYRQEQQ